MEGGFLHAFVQLEKMRMSGADADPEDIRPAFAGKRSETGNGKEERFPRDGREIFLERFLYIARNVAEETESQMHLFGRKPADAAQMRIQFRETLRDGVRKL